MERSTIFNGEIHYFDWVIFNSELWNGLLVRNAGSGWEWGNGIIIDSYRGSFPKIPYKAQVR